MARFDVRYLDGSAVAERRVEAPDMRGVAAALGIAPLQVLAVRDVPSAATSPRAAAFVRARPLSLQWFSKELSILLGAGVPLLEALTTLREKEGDARSAAALDAVLERLRAGHAFSVALAARPDAFDALFLAVVASAERTGQLQQALTSHAGYLAWTGMLRDRLVAASVYPVMLLAAGSAVSMFLLIYVVPRFAGLLDGLGGDVPAASRALLALGAWAGQHPLLSLIVAASLLAAPWLVWQVKAWRERLLDAIARLPGLAERLRLIALARLYRTLAMLLSAGLPVASALPLAREVVGPRLRVPVDTAAQAVMRGERLSQALLDAGLCTPVSLRMVRVGERSGGLGTMLGEAAGFYDDELARLSELVTRLVNPLLMLVMGALIGTIVVLMYLPIFQLMEQVQ